MEKVKGGACLVEHGTLFFPFEGDKEILREKGQFWTPDWLAEAMVTYLLAGGCDHVFDPAVGEGAFFRAAKKVALEMGRDVTLSGMEIDPEVLRLSVSRGGLSAEELCGVEIGNFVLKPPNGKVPGIVANPPYIRHHRIPLSVKSQLRTRSARMMGQPVDGRVGLHIHFLLDALELLQEGGRLAILMPADTCEGVFSTRLWTWICRRYRLEAVLTFSPEASPFPRIDTNPVVLWLRNAAPASTFFWAKCSQSYVSQLNHWVLSGFADSLPGLRLERRELVEGIETGLSRERRDGGEEQGVPLRSYARVKRGIATGDNRFFFLTEEQVERFNLPLQFLLPAIGRSRDVRGDVITAEHWREIGAKGRPVWLFSPDGRSVEDFPFSVRDYLRYGEELGIHKKSLVSARSVWYKMERRSVPPFLFAYLGRRNVRFIRNLAGVVPLTGFLCIYPHRRDEVSLQKLWLALNHPESLARLAWVGKSYGNGAIKVEPRALERLLLPHNVLQSAGLFKSGGVES